MTIVLGIEMSNPTASPDASVVALARCANDGSVVEYLAHAPMQRNARGSDGVTSLIDEICKHAHVSARDIGRIVVGIGPGGYTALRITATTAKVLASTIGCPVAPVPASLIALSRIESTELPAMIALASKNDKAWCARVDADDQGIRTITQIGVIGSDELVNASIRCVFADTHLPASMRSACENAEIRVCPIVLDARDCIAVSTQIANVDPMGLGPIYAREPDAVTQWRERHG